MKFPGPFTLEHTRSIREPLTCVMIAFQFVDLGNSLRDRTYVVTRREDRWTIDLGDEAPCMGRPSWWAVLDFLLRMGACDVEIVEMEAAP